MTAREAAPSATPSWLRPLGPDPDLADVASRAAVVGRMAGRVAALASDLQLLAMLLQDAAGGGWTASSAEASASRDALDAATERVEGRRAGSQAEQTPPIPQESAFVPRGAPGTGEAHSDDPFARAEAAVGALRAALRPGGGSPDGTEVRD